MIPALLITLWFSGYNISIDAQQLYNIQTISQCQKILPQVIKSWGSNDGSCMYGDILLPTQGV